ncbi:DUF4189 domain-containing protein [Mycobacterium sp. 852002-40037_SCH5390672]|uniref:DUF4189 domain-containing protein n=1 Tax=Mycobacterium sp. 852002-40037_SCH5390672 TaxID=1834089 RepID=UPI000804C05A|nr:DUF4189 domain-containing protein [Mycobacterium sp. 852002-40037_SCH5390672]OBB90732.1 hypothetical protein A5782_16445 [Mycobacterium sp. 852002-40037_SCH5390672]
MRSIIAVVVAVGCAIVALPAPTASAEDDFVALAVSVGSGRAAGWGTGGSQDQANQLALAHCTAEAGDVCEVVAGTRNGCASVAFDRVSGRFQGGSGPDSTASTSDALAKLGSPNGRIKATHCSS